MQASLFHLIDDYLIISTSLFRKWIRREKKKTVTGQKLFDPVSPPCFQKHDKSVHCHLAISSFIIIFFPLNWAMEMRPFENSSTWSLQLYTLITNWKAFVFEHVGISFFFFFGFDMYMLSSVIFRYSQYLFKLFPFTIWTDFHFICSFLFFMLGHQEDVHFCEHV